MIATTPEIRLMNGNYVTIIVPYQVGKINGHICYPVGKWNGNEEDFQTSLRQCYE